MDRSATKKRVGFALGGEETPEEALSSQKDDLETILDEEEQDEIVKQISMLGEQSSLLWRVAALVLDASCFIVYAFIALPHIWAFDSTPLAILYRRSIILLEIALGSLSALTEFITTLPEPSTPTRQLPHIRYTLTLKEKVHQMLQLPPELSNSSMDVARLRLSAPLIAATGLAGIRALTNCWMYMTGHMQLDSAVIFSASFLVLFISFLARSYANDLDRDLGELRQLKYANKGV